MPEELLVHATCVSIDSRGILLRGPPGSGKSNLALQLIDSPGHGLGSKLKVAKLVSDDQVLIMRQQQDLIARPPPAIASLLEIRGFGIVRLPYQAEARLVLSIRLMPEKRIERLPETSAEFAALGLAIPEVDVDPRACGAASKIRAVLAAIGEK